jgi:LysM repeat protein
MKRSDGPGLIARLIFWMVLLWSGTAALPASAQADVPAQLLQLVNQVRAEHGLPPFQVNASLAVAAQNQANFNAANAGYGHSGAGGSSPQDRATAAGFTGYVVENVVGGSDLSPQQGVTWWVNSPVHFNTLISTRYPEAGTGYAVKGRQRHYTLVVGRRSDAPPAQAGNAQLAEPPAIVVPITLSAPRPDGSIVHTVQAGQTLWAIAARYEVRLSDLFLFNNLDEDAFIQPGDELMVRLAEGQAPPPTPTPPLHHVVRTGETLWTIAARYRLSLADLLWLNGVSEETILRPGDELTVRLAEGQSPPPTPTPQLKYAVIEGDSLWSIAARYGLSLDGLLALNDLQAGALLRPGQELWIRPQPSPTPTTPLPAAATPAGSLPVAMANTGLAAQPPGPPVAPGGTATPAPSGAAVSTLMPGPGSGAREASLVPPSLALFVGIGLAVTAALILWAGRKAG